MAARKRTKPWKKPAPKSSSHTTLTPAQKKKAKRAAKKAGRPHPNLVDNMRVASTAKKKKRGASTRKKSSGRKKSASRKKNGRRKRSST